MEMKSNLVAISSLMLMLASTATLAQSVGGVFDVTKYGAKPNTDITQALANAWKEACASTSASKVLIPKGIYKLSEADLKGPCKSPIELQLQGTVQAPTDPKGEEWVTFSYIDRFTLSGSGVFDGQGKAGWAINDCDKSVNCNKLPISLRFNFITNSIVRDVTSLDSKNFHVNVLGCNNLAFNHVTIKAPENSPNTDGIHIGRSIGINITHTNIGTGDDCISIGDGSKKVTITDVTCGPGHGISIGSLGKYSGEEPVAGIYVKNSKLTNTQNGVRIKTWPSSPAAGSASDMHFEGIEMVNVSFPIVIDQEYCPWNQCNMKSPSKIKISKVSFKNIRGTSATPVAVKLVCSGSVPCEGVEVADIDLTYHGNEGEITSQCANVKPLKSGKQNPPTCSSPVSRVSSSTL